MERSRFGEGAEAVQEDPPRPLMRWLGIAAGVLAILTFFGISDYQHLFSALGWRSSPSAPPHDSADSGTCASAAADATTANMDAPVAAGDKVIFYGDQGTAFGRLFAHAKDETLRSNLLAVSLDLGMLQNQWFGVAQGTGGDESIAATVGSLRQDESVLESWCRTHTGTW